MSLTGVVKKLYLQADLCTGCRLCEAVCSVWHEGVTNPEKARLRVVANEDDNIFKPVACRQCRKPRCISACPSSAITRDEQTLIMHLEPGLCEGCGKCVEACPFGALQFDTRAGKPLVCDLCQGNPQCARFCDSMAIVFAARKSDPQYRGQDR